MEYLNYSLMETADPESFQRTRPYPWINPCHWLTEAGYRRLLHSLPPLSMFTPSFGLRRAHGQSSHDRYVLEYHTGLEVDAAWHEFVAELQASRYQFFLRNMFGRGRIQLGFHWHYAPRGASVSPHCDNLRKLGSHIFYFNTEQDWEPAWGGATLILDDQGRFPRNTAPEIDDFKRFDSSRHMGNCSLLFQRRPHAWHAVRELECPQGRYRKVFIVVINDRVLAMMKNVANRIRGKSVGGY